MLCAQQDQGSLPARRLSPCHCKKNHALEVPGLPCKPKATRQTCLELAETVLEGLVCTPGDDLDQQTACLDVHSDCLP
jgi:hypothetical protein